MLCTSLSYSVRDKVVTTNPIKGLKKPKSERVFQEAVEPEPRKDQDEADLDFESDANPDFDINDFGSVGPDLAEDEDADASEVEHADAASSEDVR